MKANCIARCTKHRESCLNDNILCISIKTKIRTLFSNSAATFQSSFRSNPSTIEATRYCDHRSLPPSLHRKKVHNCTYTSQLDPTLWLDLPVIENHFFSRPLTHSTVDHPGDLPRAAPLHLLTFRLIQRPI